MFRFNSEITANIFAPRGKVKLKGRRIRLKCKPVRYNKKVRRNNRGPEKKNKNRVIAMGGRLLLLKGNRPVIEDSMITPLRQKRKRGGHD